jgi:predicted metal-dependent enzyme (double-stranded beta helix superfamily)
MTISADPTILGPATLAERAQAIADRPEDWVHRVRLSADGRWYERLHIDAESEVWLISWLPGQATGFHDHGGANGAFAVALGTLAEHRIQDARDVETGLTRGDKARRFGPGYIHDVRNESAAPAVSVHVYSPPLTAMRRYDLDQDGKLVPLATENAEDW